MLRSYKTRAVIRLGVSILVVAFALASVGYAQPPSSGLGRGVNFGNALEAPDEGD